MNNCSTITKPAMNMVGISYCGPYSTFPDEAIHLQSEFLSRKHEIEGDVKTTVLYSPYFGNEVFATYWACFEVPHLEQVPPGMVQFTIPQRTYAMSVCTNKRIGEGYEQLTAWMNEEKLAKRENAVSLEIFYIDEHLEEEQVELLIPIDEP
ncbi:effector binding domain-containing protein [Paenibacillus sp. MWE-103]|uniref:Effector binding domain-containing protein n=1 Tax=Paenibacillus artemisiicola TaxID=1172618 RepID=A0ABS3WB81_9BACL|nr:MULTISPECIES: GyrI-like domain-containing protein [Paenibacillus]MBO7745575.1 effector binding domain-containing protein [Paenibacillus artemisiicola]SFI27065.1 Predicted transcriptional regulator YdeE, contains AraC-type DNA-binding domain [Paenibacillus sp. UNC496MF]